MARLKVIEEFCRHTQDCLNRVIHGEALQADDLHRLLDGILDLEESDHGKPWILASGLLCALKVRGETRDELLGAAEALRKRQRPLALRENRPLLLDTCGTGGDGAQLMNLSTLAAFVVAALGVPVAKHGNRSVSSKCGSADLLESLGLPLTQDCEALEQSLSERNFCFLFAPHYHPALAKVAPLRRDLGVRTMFNILGPLLNPAPVTHQVIGVFSRDLMRPMAQAAVNLGRKRVLVVHGEGGLDEASPWGQTWGIVMDQDGETEFEWNPGSFGTAAVDPDAVRGAGPRQNAQRSLSLLKGSEPELARAVAINSSLALWLTDRYESLPEAYAASVETLASGATECLLNPTD